MSQPDETLMYPNEMIKTWLREHSQQQNLADDSSLDFKSDKEAKKSDDLSVHAGALSCEN